MSRHDTEIGFSNFSTLLSHHSSFALTLKIAVASDFFFDIEVFFHNHSRITGLQGIGEGIS